MENDEWKTRYETAIYNYKNFLKLFDEFYHAADDACEVMELHGLHNESAYKKLKEQCIKLY